MNPETSGGVRFAAVALLPVSILFSMARADTGAGAVRQLLSGRTAHVVSANGTGNAFHGTDGRVAIVEPGQATPVTGRWSVGDDGVYCYWLDAGGRQRCFRVALAGADLRLVSAADGSVSTINRLEPGDVYELMGGGSVDDVDCNCRLTARRRGEDGER